MFFPFALITSFNLPPNLHYLIVVAVWLSDIIDNAHYATLSCSAAAGNQIFYLHFPIAFLLIIAELHPLHPSHPSIQLSKRECLPSLLMDSQVLINTEMGQCKFILCSQLVCLSIS